EESGGAVGGGRRGNAGRAGPRVGEGLRARFSAFCFPGSTSLREPYLTPDHWLVNDLCGRIFLPIWQPMIPLSNIWQRPRLAKRGSLRFLNSTGKTWVWRVVRLS